MCQLFRIRCKEKEKLFSHALPSSRHKKSRLGNQKCLFESVSTPVREIEKSFESSFFCRTHTHRFTIDFCCLIFCGPSCAGFYYLLKKRGGRELWETNLTVFKLVNRGGASGSDLEINFLVFFFFMLLESKQNFFLEIVFSLDLDVRVPQSLMLIYFTLMCPIFAHSTRKNVAIQNKSFNNSQQVSVLLSRS